MNQHYLKLKRISSVEVFCGTKAEIMTAIGIINSSKGSAMAELVTATDKLVKKRIREQKIWGQYYKIPHVTELNTTTLKHLKREAI